MFIFLLDTAYEIYIVFEIVNPTPDPFACGF